MEEVLLSLSLSLPLWLFDSTSELESAGEDDVLIGVGSLSTTAFLFDLGAIVAFDRSNSYAVDQRGISSELMRSAESHDLPGYCCQARNIAANGPKPSVSGEMYY